MKMTDPVHDTTQYLLLFRGTHWDKGLSPDELQRVMGEWMAWFDRISASGKMVGSNPLLPEGRVLTGKKGRNVADGPFAESKETIAGYFLLKVDSLEEAIELGQQCPALEYGMQVEVRPVASACPPSLRVQEMEAAAATAA
ncbi:MAG: YciI family protein [Verrucomicrobium sp.]|nr:YciI family protein [Verrucomicrobium sp.]